MKPNETITRERYRRQLMRLSRVLRKNDHNTSRGTEKWFYNMTTLGLTLPNPSKYTWKRSNGESYPIRRIPQILRPPIITFIDRWHMVWLISSSAHIRISYLYLFSVLYIFKKSSFQLLLINASLRTKMYENGWIPGLI